MTHQPARRILRSSLPIAAFVAIAVLFGIHSATQENTHDRTLRRFGPASDRMENPEARDRFDWMRLRDPRSKMIPSGIRGAELSYAKTLPTRMVKNIGSLAKGAASAWVSRGPVNQGGRTRALGIDISNENIILAGGVSGGMWRSTDGGATWTRSTSLSDSIQSVTCVAQDPRSGHTSVWYYGTGERIANSADGGGGASYLGDGLFKSTDGGATWNQISSTVDRTPQSFSRTLEYVWNIVVNPTDGSVVVALYGEIIKSTDGGSTWSSILGSGNPPSAEFTDVTVTSTGVLYATLGGGGATVKGIFRSADGGATWATITPSTWPSTYRRVVLAHSPSNENVVYFLAETPGSGFEKTTSDGKEYTSLYKYTYVSGDGTGGGGTWENRSANIPGYGGSVGDFSHQGSYDLDIAVSPANEHAVFIGGTNLYRSTNGFADNTATTWIGGYATTNDISQYANHHPDQHALVFFPSNASMALSGHDGGISKTSDILATSDVTWELKNTGYITSQFYSLAIDMATAGDPTIIGGLQDNGNLYTLSADGSANWKVFSGGGDGTFSAIADNRTLYYLGTQNGAVYKQTLDVNGDEEAFAKVTPTGASNFMFVTPYLLDPANTNRMYMAVDDRVWRNSDLTAIPLNTQAGSDPNNTTAINWTAMANSAVSGALVTALEASTSPARRLYYGTNTAKVFRIDGADAGDPTPTDISSTMFTTDAYVSSIAANPRNADTVVVVFSNYSAKSLFLTTDGGTTWSDIGGNLEQNPDGSGNGPSCRWATILPEAGGVRVYVATSIGVYSTAALNGASTIWEQEGANVIGNVVVTMIKSRPADNLVVAATHANGIYSTTATPTSVEEVAALTPESYGLQANYPNPFNPSTTIGYVLPEAGPVQLSIYDASGRKIAAIVNEHQPAGRHEATWNGTTHAGRTVASGTYFYRLDAPGLRQTRKMMLLK